MSKSNSRAQPRSKRSDRQAIGDWNDEDGSKGRRGRGRRKQEKEEMNKSKNQNQKDSKGSGVFFERQKEKTLCRMHAINNALGRKALTPDSFYAYCDTFDMTHRSYGSREFFFILSDSCNNSDGCNNLLSFILLKKFRISSTYVSFSRHRSREADRRRELESEPEQDQNQDQEDSDGLAGELEARLHIQQDVSDGNNDTDDLNRAELDDEDEDDDEEEEAEDEVELFDDEDCDAFLCFSRSHIWCYRRVDRRWYCLDSLAPKPVLVKRHALSEVEGVIKLHSKRGQHSKPSSSNVQQSSGSNCS